MKNYVLWAHQCLSLCLLHFSYKLGNLYGFCKGTKQKGGLLSEVHPTTTPDFSPSRSLSSQTFAPFSMCHFGLYAQGLLSVAWPHSMPCLCWFTVLSVIALVAFIIPVVILLMFVPVIWHEKHLQNFSVLQRVYVSSLVNLYCPLGKQCIF
jgi:hypothetical protein